jgi:hypothetical protein
MAGGRPSVYQENYCVQVVEWGAAGKSVTWMAAQLDVSRDTIYEWAKVHSEFSDALTRAREKAQAWWEDQGQDGIKSPMFNGGVWAKNMGARFKADWGDTKSVELSGKDGKPIQSESKASLDVSGLTLEQLRAIASIPLN